MGIRFRKSIKLLPGIRLGLSKSWFSFRLGGKGIGVTLSRNGIRGSASALGTGLSYSTNIGTNSKATKNGTHMARYQKYTCYECKLIRPANELKQVEAQLKSGKTSTKWVCLDDAAHHNPNYYGTTRNNGSKKPTGLLKKLFLLLIVIGVISAIVKKENTGSATKSEPATATKSIKTSDVAKRLGIENTDILEAIAYQRIGDEDNVYRSLTTLKPSTKLHSGDKNLARQLNSNGVSAFKAGSINGAVTLFKKALDADPSDVEAANNLGFAYCLNGDYRNSAIYLQNALELDPDRSNAWFNLAQLLALNDDPSDAQAAGLIAFRVSTNKKNFEDFLAKTSVSETDPKLISLYTAMLQRTKK